jgi:hypothetical protein
VYSRQIDQQTLTLAPSGWTYRHTFVLYDKETGSLWYPYEKGLMGIQGHFFKRWLPVVDFQVTPCGDWVGRHPESELLK